MEKPYHAAITREALQSHFHAPALEQVIAANQAQDALRYQLGRHHHFHFDNDKIAESRAYIEAQHAQIQALIGGDDPGPAQRAALGRLTHSAQDLYAHSNYVDLWLAAHGGLAATSPEQIDGLVPELLHHPDLHTGHAAIWHVVYCIPLLETLARRIYVAPNSHEAMNLDDPSRGPHFAYALAAARQRTEHEYQRAIRAVLETGGPAAVEQFHRHKETP